MLDEQLKDLQERNFLRTQEIIKQMGTKYLLHPANNVTRQKYKSSLRKAKRKQEFA